ncbi:MAG: hypothetical protein EOM54_10010 [Clostridia bacterium]|nr:hypothetical protein [Clostridia bacterium]
MVVPNDDYTFDIYVNETFSEIRQREVIAHELEHIKRDHFYREIPITLKEAEADAAPPVSDCELADEYYLYKALHPEEDDICYLRTKDA